MTLVELVPRILPLEDEEISQMMERELKKAGWTFGPALLSIRSSGNPTW